MELVLFLIVREFNYIVKAEICSIKKQSGREGLIVYLLLKILKDKNCCIYKLVGLD